MKNGEMSVKRKTKKSGQPKREKEYTESVRMQTEAKPVRKPEKQVLEGEREQADYRTEACLESFFCANCGKEIHPEGAGSNHRNHCPHCLYSLHVDEEAGDRKASCHGKMEPIAVVAREDGDWSILHRCRRCGKLNLNRVLADDNPLLLVQLAVKPLASPPFPLSYIEHFLKEKNTAEEQ